MGNDVRRPGPWARGPGASPLGSSVSIPGSSLDRRREAHARALERGNDRSRSGLGEGDGCDGHPGSCALGLALRSGAGGWRMNRDVPDWWKRWARLLWVAALVLVALSFASMLRAPAERIMGPVQKIVYIHVPSAIATLLAFGVTFAAGIAYLATKGWIWDAIGAASCEVGLVFATVVMITGPLWARSAWNTWWTWEPRLTTFLILWILYAAYHVVRASLKSESRRTISSVMGIVFFVNLPIVWKSVEWWRGS